MERKRNWLLAACFLLLSDTAFAACYDWPLGRGDAYRRAFDGNSIYVVLPNLPREIARVKIHIRGVVTPRIMFGECYKEKMRGKSARNYVIKLLATAEKVRFCEPEWNSEGPGMLATVKIDKHDLAEVLIDKGFGFSTADGKTSWCNK